MKERRHHNNQGLRGAEGEGGSMKRKPFDEALAAIDGRIRGLSNSFDLDLFEREIHELRAALRVLVTAGKLHKYERGKFRQGDARDVCTAIYRARKVEERKVRS